MEKEKEISRKIRLIRFIVLSIVLYLISDFTGRWFIPEGLDVPGMFLALIWVLCFLNGAFMFYAWRKLERKWLKWTVAIIWEIIFIALLYICKFYEKGGSGLIGHKISVTLMPLIGFLVEGGVTAFIRWYGKLIKRVFHLDSIRSGVFAAFMLIPVILAVLLFIGGYRLAGTLSDKGKDLEQFIVEGEVNHNTDRREPVRQYDRLFNDLNDTQLEAARANGLSSPIKSDEVENNRKLVRIESNRYYEVDKLTHSMPYLVPKAAALLEDMGRAFQDSLFNRGYNRGHRFTVTSVLRTEESVKQLQKTNTNSTVNSCHCYGTTVDISYFTFQTPDAGKTASVDKMRQILYQVAYDMKRQGRCYVKYEKQQTCLHITVR